MDRARSVFSVDTSVEEDRPQIDFERERHQAIDWLRVGQVLRKVRPISDFPSISLIVDDPNATIWDFYSVPGTLGLFSDHAIECIGEPTFRLFNRLRATINGKGYSFLRCNETLPCFDHKRSIVVPFPSNPERIMDVTRYRFKMEIIPDPICFLIPERYHLFATQSVKLAAENCCLSGLDFRLLE
jgi:hypothetical protein